MPISPSPKNPIFAIFLPRPHVSDQSSGSSRDVREAITFGYIERWAQQSNNWRGLSRSTITFARNFAAGAGPGVSGEPESIVDLHQILFATDLSAVSVAALPYAISLAEEINARLYILHVAENPVEAAGENALRDRLRNLVAQGAKLTSQPKVIVGYGPPAERVLAVAEELAMDLIVLGVKRTPMHFEASPNRPLATAHKVVSQAICPMLTVRG